MSNELIKKAYEYYGGAWPDDNMDTVMYSSYHGYKLAKSMDGVSPYKSSSGGTFLLSVWEVACTKADFDAYGESLRAPEGATHKIKRKGQSDVFLKDLDLQAMRYSVWDTNGWVDKILGSQYVSDNIEKIEIADKAVEEKWMPDPDSMCEIKHDNEILSWKKAKYIGVNTVGSKKYAVVFFPYISEYKNYKLDDSLKFRPIKTEAVKDATDVYHACELLVKEGFKQCAG